MHAVDEHMHCWADDIRPERVYPCTTIVGVADALGLCARHRTEIVGR